MYSVSIYFKVKPVQREGILRPWPVPFLPNLLRPKIQVHFNIWKLVSIGGVFPTIAIIKIHDNGSRGGHRPPLHQFTVSNYEHCYKSSFKIK